MLSCIASGAAERQNEKEITEKQTHIKVPWYSDIYFFPLKLSDAMFLLAWSGTRAAVHNTGIMLSNLYTERGKTCDICVTPSLKPQTRPNPLTGSSNCWEIQWLDCPGEPLKVVVSAPAAAAAGSPALKHPILAGTCNNPLKMTWTNRFLHFFTHWHSWTFYKALMKACLQAYEGMLCLKYKNPSLFRRTSLEPQSEWVWVSYQGTENHHRETQITLLAKGGLRTPFWHVNYFEKVLNIVPWTLQLT